MCFSIQIHYPTKQDQATDFKSKPWSQLFTIHVQETQQNTLCITIKVVKLWL
jgi:hypothetical protein